MAEYLTNTADLTKVADSIRAKGGTSAPLVWPEGYADAVNAITGAPKDPHTLLLLHGESLTDSSTYNVPLSNNGVTISTMQSKFGGKSLYFDGNAWINFPQEYAPYKDNDFTIDWWEYCTTYDVNHQSRYFSSDAGGPYGTLGLLLGHLGKQAYCGDGWSMINGAEMFNIVQNQWVHWAAVRHGNTFTTYRNGKKFAQTSIVGPIPYDTKTMHCIGGWRYSPGQKWIGYMDEFRISDIARWTTDFTPPDAPYDNTQNCKPEQEKTATATKNGPVVVTPDPGKVLSKATVTVAVPSDAKPEQTYSKTYTSNGSYPITPTPGNVISGGTITVNTPVKKPEEEKTVSVTSNGQTVVTPTSGKVMSKVTINTNTPVPKSEQTKTVSTVKNGPVVVTPDNGKVLSSATVNVNVPNDTSDATATAAEVFSGKTAYLATGKQTGTFTIAPELTAQQTKLDAIKEALKDKGSAGGDELLNSVINKSVTEITSSAAGIGNYVFYNCSALTSASFPAATSIGNYAFENCSALTSASFPAATSIGNYAFQNCRALTTASFPAATSIFNYAFNSCDTLKELRLESPTLCKAYGDPRINSTCKIYVPAALIGPYKAAANWSKYASQFVAV